MDSSLSKCPFCKPNICGKPWCPYTGEVMSKDHLFYIWEKGKSIQFTRNFNSKEFECRCSYDDCIEQRILKSHVDKLQEKRDKWNKPIKITSAGRCKKHNKDIGGANNSMHLIPNNGYATDIQVFSMHPDNVADNCELEFSGLGRYNTFTHIDSRPEGKARWDKRNK